MDKDESSRRARGGGVAENWPWASLDEMRCSDEEYAFRRDRRPERNASFRLSAGLVRLAGPCRGFLGPLLPRPVLPDASSRVPLRSERHAFLPFGTEATS